MGFRPPLPFQPCLDGVVAKLTPSGSLAYGTYLRGDNEIGVSHEVVSGIVVDATGNATVVGTTTSLSFPTTPGANRSAGVCPFSPCAPGRVFITKLNSDGTGLVSSATLGSASFFDSGTGIAVQSFVSPGGGPSPGIAIDALGQAVVTGWTKASDLPVVNAQQPRLASPGPLRLASNGSVATAIGAPPGSTAITKLTGAANGTLYALDNLRAAAFRSSDNGATWTLLEAPFAVGRDDLSLDPNDGTTLYTTAGKSVDGGTTWTSFGKALTSAPLARPGVPNVLYATIFGGSPVSRSVNGGATWTSISHGIPFDPPGSLQITLSDPNVMYYLSPFVGLYGTVDDGALWTARTTPPDTAQTLAVNPSQPLTVYIGGSSGVWKSVNGGSTWTRTLPGGSFTNLLASSATLVFASTSEHALYVSVDGGDTWAPVEGASASISGADFSAPGVAFAISSPIPDGFVAALSATGALLYESYLGGVHTDIPYALTTTPDNAIVVAGSTGSPDFPNSNAVQPTYGGGNSDAFVTKLRFPQIVFSVDTPVDQTTAFMPFKLGGWALDRGSASDDGIDGIHVWAFSAAGVPTFIGAPVPNVARPDVAAVYGSPFANAGFNVTVDGLTPGTYTFAIYPHSSVTSTFAPPRVMTITVAPGALAAIGVPANGSTTFGGANLGGWAIDRASTTDTGISTVHVWAYPNPGSGQAPIFLGVADYGVARPDVGAIFGSQFTNSGFNLTLPPLEPGPYLFVASPFSTMTNSFQAPATVLATAGPQQPFGAVDLPAANATVGSGFAVAGWAIDRSAPTGTGVSSVHVYAFAVGSSTPIFLGAATLGFARADIGAIFGSPFTPSGFAVATAPLPPGTYDVYTYARSTVSGYAAVRGVRVIVQ